MAIIRIIAGMAFIANSCLFTFKIVFPKWDRVNLAFLLLNICVEGICFYGLS